MPPFDSPHFTLWLPQLLCAVFLAILFLQSGLDKVVDWKGNLGWLTGHFSKSPLKGVVTPMLAVITLMELAAGALSALGALMLLFNGNPFIAHLGAVVSSLSLLALFFGQRMAKEYAGAAVLVPYFIVAVASVYLMRYV